MIQIAVFKGVAYHNLALGEVNTSAGILKNACFKCVFSFLGIMNNKLTPEAYFYFTITHSIK